MPTGQFINRTYNEALAVPRPFWKKAAPGIAAMVGGPLLAGPISGLFTGGAAAAGAPAAGAATGGVGGAGAAATAATATGKLGTIGKLFSSPGLSTAVNAGLSLAGMRQGNKAADQARTDTLNAQREAIKIERERLEMEATNANLDREDQKALNAAINALKQQELDLMVEDRDYNRQLGESDRSYERGIYADRQQRLEPYRQASQAALQKLMGTWG